MGTISLVRRLFFTPASVVSFILGIVAVRLVLEEWSIAAGSGQSPHYELIIVPIFFAILPTLWIATRITRLQRKWRSSHHRCIRCAYDLTGNTGVSPECGMAGKKGR